MGLSAAFLIAGSGLAANGRATAVVSSNIANALTEGYARREAIMTQAFPGTVSGVSVGSIARNVDTALAGEARRADAGAAGTGLLAAFAARAEAALGQPGEEGALGTVLARLETAFTEAAVRPDVPARLSATGRALADVAGSLRGLSAGLQTAREEADRGIATDVAALNDGLQAVARLDSRIISTAARGGDTGALQDERQRTVDRLSSIVPLREIPRPDGRAALVTTGGLILLDGRAATVGFTATRSIAAEMTLAAGDLSGLTVDGRPVALNAGPGLMDGGALAARFAVRDTAAPAAQAELDALARDLVERLSDPALDPTNPPGAPGLLTDQGGAFLPVNEAGLAARLAVNPAADPAAGGALFRLRDGLGATVPGPVGDGALLSRAAERLAEVRPTASAAVTPGRRTAEGLAADITSLAATRRLQAEGRQATAGAEAATLRDAVAAGGVNTDAEMQRLIALEQAYAANARVLSVVDSLFAQLLEAVR